MVVYKVSVKVIPGMENDFIKATKENYADTRKEKGNLRFDLLQSTEDKSSFLLYEVYRSEDAVDAHKSTRHYKVWRKTVAPMMARDRIGEKFTPVIPVSEEEW